MDGFGEEVVNLNIFDIKGNLILEKTFFKDDPILFHGNELNLKPGIYIIQAKGGSTTLMKKLIVKP